MTAIVKLSDTQRALVDAIYAEEAEIKHLRLQLKLRMQETKMSRENLILQLKRKAEYNAVSPDDDIELTGHESVVYLSRDVRKAEIDSDLFDKMTKSHITEVSNLVLKELRRRFPRLYATYVKMLPTGTRKFLFVRGEALSADDNDDTAESEE